MSSQPRQHSFLAFNPHGFHRVAYAEWGARREQHVVICVHGLTRNSRDFDMLAADLASRCRVVCVDVVGRGKSDWLEHKEDYGFPLYLADAATLIALVSGTMRTGPVAQFIQRFRGKSLAPFIDWVGTSMGGLIGMMLASKPNSPIRRLVLNDVGPFVPWQALARLKNMHMGKVARFSDLNDAERHLRVACADFGPLDKEQWKHVTRYSVRPLEEGGYGLAWDPAIARTIVGGDRKGIDFGSDLLFGADLWPVWNAVRCPTLVLRGAKSTLLSAATARRMCRSGPKARIVEISGVGHAPWLMSADQIDLVRDFLLAPDSNTRR